MVATWNGRCASDCALRRVGCSRWKIDGCYLERVMCLRLHSDKGWVFQVETDSRSKFGNDVTVASLLSATISVIAGAAGNLLGVPGGR